MVPGLTASGLPACLRCDPLPLDLTCGRCGEEAWLFKKACCWRCELIDQMSQLLAGPDGAIPDELQPLNDAVTSMARPNSGVTWLRNPAVRTLLQGLGTGQIPLTHKALDDLPSSRTVEYLRDLLTAAGGLPGRDRHQADYEMWLDTKARSIVDEEQRSLVVRFGTWHHLRKMRRSKSDTTTNAFLSAKQSVTVAIDFLAWLDVQGATLDDCNQALVDAWLADGPTTRHHVEGFIYWAMNQRYVPRSIVVPRRSHRTEVLQSEEERVDLLGQVLTDDELPLEVRVAGGLVLLLGQPASRICALTTDDVRLLEGGTEMHLGEDWLHLPDPFSALVQHLLTDRPNMSTAANKDSVWLFPGILAGRHMSPGSLNRALATRGIKTLAGRNRARRQLVSEIPAPIVARAIGIAPETATKHAALAGVDYGTYPERIMRGTLGS